MAASLNRGRAAAAETISVAGELVDKLVSAQTWRIIRQLLFSGL
jgi:hypothetical protein